jgi:hypothetical protein
MNIARSLLTVIAAISLVSAPSEAVSSEYLKAVTYFGSAWPANYWNSNISRAKSDFAEIRADGFNSVVLVVPWGEFQPGVDPIRYNEDAYQRLTKVCQAAKREGLNVFMRVSYLWDMYPGRQLPNTERINALFGSDTLMPAWQQYLSRIGAATRGCASGSFISWEDFWFVIELSTRGGTEIEGAALSRQIGFDAWVKRRVDQDYFSKYAATQKRLGAYPIPNRNSPDFRVVYEWFDDQLTKRFMPALAKNLANASIEARVDDDPIYDGEKLVGRYSHKQTYKVQSSPYVMTYWAPAIGAQNHGELESAKTALARFIYMQKKIADDSSNKIFIEQFLFKDNTPGMSMNAAIAPADVGAFLREVADPMVKLTSGYGLWGARDYDASAVFNGFFSLGELDWRFKAGAKIVKSGDLFYARLPTGASIAQSILSDHGLYRGGAKSTKLRLRASGPGILNATYAGSTVRVQIGAKEELFELILPVPTANSELKIASGEGTVRLTDVYLFNFTQTADVRDSLGRPGKHLEDIRALNSLIELGTKPASRFSVSDNTLGRVSGTWAREKDGERWFAWAGPEVLARIVASGSSIRVQGFVKPSMFSTSEGCKFDVYLDSKKALTTVYKSDGPIDLLVPVAPGFQGKAVDLRITSTCVANPKQQQTRRDDRNLSFVLTEISAQSQL